MRFKPQKQTYIINDSYIQIYLGFLRFSMVVHGFSVGFLLAFYAKQLHIFQLRLRIDGMLSIPTSVRSLIQKALLYGALVSLVYICLLYIVDIPEMFTNIYWMVGKLSIHWIGIGFHLYGESIDNLWVWLVYPPVMSKQV